MQKAAAATTDPVHHSLGEALRLRRKAQKSSMQSVADAAGLSVGFISQVERGLTAPSLSSLASIARVLDIPLGDLLEQPQASGQMTRAKARTPYRVPGAALEYERLSTTFRGSTLHSVIINEPPGHRAEPISHAGEEMFFILAGSITVEIEGVAAVLHQGDSLHFDSRRIHATWNHTGAPASILWCGTMDVFGDAPDPIHNSRAPNPAEPTPTGETKP